MTGPLDPLTPVLGRWRTSGTVLDDDGRVTGEIAGTDVYTLLPGGRWIAHEVDVRVGARAVQAHELIGGAHPSGGWHMYAFDEADVPGVMRLTTLWERQVDGAWVPWMDMRFERQ